MQEFNTRKKITSSFNRLKFLKDCILEQVLPSSAPAQLKNKDHPFTPAARAYLEEACGDLKERIYVLQDERKGTQISPSLQTKLRKYNDKQRNKLERKLKRLCAKSAWKKAGKVDIVSNLSSRVLTDDEKEALALGLKFDSGKDKYTFMDHVSRNYKWNHEDIDKGFIQGVLAVCKALTDKEPEKLPRRYMKALRKLAEDPDVVVTQADKGGGVIIMDKIEYVRKMEEMLSDAATYEKKPAGFTSKSSTAFNQQARKLLKKSDKGKHLLHLLEEAPTAPRMRGLPKVHKEGLPMRPITSGIGSAPHKIAKILAKPLSSVLGAVSDAHLRNTADMMERLQEVDFSDKCLASFDVKSLFTNVPVHGALDVIKSVVDKMDGSELPLPKSDYVNLVSLCMHFGAFVFNGVEYTQHSGLAMGSPLSPVAACLFMESLESERYKQIMGDSVTWLRYVDDVLIVAPKNVDLDEKLKQLNAVNDRIQFTCEREKQGCIPFLDTKIIRHDKTVKYTVYRKPTNREDYVHFFSGHSDRVKRGVVLGFFLRAFRICSEEYLEAEIKHIMSSFQELRYPKGLLIHLKNKAIKIRTKTNKTSKRKSNDAYITIPHSNHAETVAKHLEGAGMKVAITSGKKIGEIITQGKKHDNNENSVVYKIPCGVCQKAYIGETGRGLETRLKEHRRDVRNHQSYSAFVVHIEKSNHLPNWQQATILAKCKNKEIRRATESAYIATNETINTRGGFIKWAKTAAVLSLTK